MAPESAAGATSRHSILDLAPLELDCMNALWPSGEATVRQIREALHPTRPRAYTTIMTILDRLAQKGIVERRKSGRAWVYKATVTAEEARSHALAQVVDGFFGGSSVALATHLAAQDFSLPVSMPIAALAARHKSASDTLAEPRQVRAPMRRKAARPAPETPAPESLDTALL
jgi:predicted transcriptional regulator